MREINKVTSLTVATTQNGIKRNVPTKTVLCLGNDYTVVESMESSMKTQMALTNTFTEPIFITNTFNRQKNFPKMKLGKDAKTIMRLPNAGGNSIHSEALSCDMLNVMFDAKLEKTEMELKYFPMNSKITDYSVLIRNEIFGVSVTRAMKYHGEFTDEDAEKLLTRKLYGVNASTKAVLECYRWKKQILHVWAEHKYIANVLYRTYETLPASLKNNTIVIVTVCENSPWIFFERK
mmetsp:Transcript_84440/g.126590  ORF Transcript_84440/g.126590 Transcript_84440/m.126590 type:complete len:235 (-) Transcript_84440:22-726(-)